MKVGALHLRTFFSAHLGLQVRNIKAFFREDHNNRLIYSVKHFKALNKGREGGKAKKPLSVIIYILVYILVGMWGSQIIWLLLFENITSLF